MRDSSCSATAPRPPHAAVLALLALPALLALLMPAAARTITVDNQCSGTIYPAWKADDGQMPTGSDGTSQPGGWSQASGEAYSFTVSDTWSDARVWARTGCAGSGQSLSCTIGDCDGALACSGTAMGGQGATVSGQAHGGGGGQAVRRGRREADRQLAEFTLGSQDSYDISIVDGYNLPMTITPSASACTTATCGADTDLLTMCDPSLVYPAGSSQIWSCAMPCLANIWFSSYGSGFDYTNSPSCCTGEWAGHDSCTKDMIPFYDVYKEVCPGAYVFADDDNYENAVYQCSSAPDYTITFCPGGNGQGVDPSAAAVSQDAGGAVNVAESGSASAGTSAGGYTGAAVSPYAATTNPAAESAYEATSAAYGDTTTAYEDTTSAYYTTSAYEDMTSAYYTTPAGQASSAYGDATTRGGAQTTAYTSAYAYAATTEATVSATTSAAEVSSSSARGGGGGSGNDSGGSGGSAGNDNNDSDNEDGNSNGDSDINLAVSASSSAASTSTAPTTAQPTTSDPAETPSSAPATGDTPTTSMASPAWAPTGHAHQAGGAWARPGSAGASGVRACAAAAPTGAAKRAGTRSRARAARGAG